MRNPIELPIHFKTIASFLREARDVRSGRIFVATDESHPKGTPVRLLLHVPIEGKTVRIVVEGKVTHAQNTPGDQPVGLEVQLFAFSLADQRGLLDDFTEQLTEVQSLSP